MEREERVAASMNESLRETNMEDTDKFWLTQLDARERPAFIATFAGWLLDGMDVMVYSFVMPSLILLWHISKPNAGLLGTSTLLLSSVGQAG